jgi:hypothetical protein
MLYSLGRLEELEIRALAGEIVGIAGSLSLQAPVLGAGRDSTLFQDDDGKTFRPTARNIKFVN